MCISPPIYTITMHILNQIYLAVIEIQLWTHGWMDTWAEVLLDSGHFNIPHGGRRGIIKTREMQGVAERMSVWEDRER